MPIVICNWCAWGFTATTCREASKAFLEVRKHELKCRERIAQEVVSKALGKRSCR
jgi:coenzyme F420-reducing hydrogenase delta subunit